jgi:4,5-DOPA dioxygenase extradiol
MSRTRRQFLASVAGAAALVHPAAARAFRIWVEDEVAPTPTLYVAHGGPDLAVSETRGAELAAWGARLPPPRGYIGITPHTRAHGIRLAAVGPGRPLMSFPRRFLPDADSFSYATPDSTAMADRVAELLAFPFQRGGDGINHTIWQPLLHLRPQADVPVIQLALPFGLSDRQLFELGRKLAPLRTEGFCILASGNLTHNLGQMRLGGQPAWAGRFDAWVVERLASQDLDALVDWRRANPDAYLAHPDDGGHFDVLLVALGASLDVAARATFPVEGFEDGGVSKRCIQMG